MLAWIDSLAPGDTVTFTRSDNSDSYAVYEIETLFTQLGGLEPYQGTVRWKLGTITSIPYIEGVAYQISRNGPRGPQGPAGTAGTASSILTSTTKANTITGMGQIGLSTPSNNGNNQQKVNFENPQKVGDVFNIQNNSHLITISKDANALISLTLNFQETVGDTGQTSDTAGGCYFELRLWKNGSVVKKTYTTSHASDLEEQITLTCILPVNTSDSLYFSWYATPDDGISSASMGIQILNNGYLSLCDLNGGLQGPAGPSGPDGPTGPEPVSKNYTITVNGNNKYEVNGLQQAPIWLFRGRRYVFSVNATGHPFHIQTSV